jgi:hypothetical protein
MTIHKSAAVTAGIMPDHARAGVVFCRSAEYSTANDNIVSADTLQLVPIPKNAKVLRVDFFHEALPAGVTGSDLGYGGDANAFFSSLTLTGEKFEVYPGQQQNAHTTVYFGATDGFLHTFTADDTIDLTFPKAPTKIPTATTFKIAVWYKMTGTIADET